jgi:ribosomal protein L11 methyltransferase
MPYQNWNAIWESSFQPVAVDDYVNIRALFHDPAPVGFKYEILIAPKMAFGTGHHATTYMMLQAMSKISFAGKRVLDFGCGTGILAVVAAKEGASEVIGVDIQTEAIENSVEHAQLNQVASTCRFLEGGLEKAGSDPFDIILANINAQVLIDSLANLKALCKKAGYLLLSGILEEDLDKLTTVILSTGMTVSYTLHKDNWVQITAVN